MVETKHPPCDAIYNEKFARSALNMHSLDFFTMASHWSQSFGHLHALLSCESISCIVLPAGVDTAHSEIGSQLESHCSAGYECDRPSIGHTVTRMHPVITCGLCKCTDMDGYGWKVADIRGSVAKYAQFVTNLFFFRICIPHAFKALINHVCDSH